MNSEETKDLLSALYTSNVRVKFTSVWSGNTINKLCTLQNVKFNQSPYNDAIVVYCVDSKSYDDIRISTIESWIKE